MDYNISQADLLLVFNSKLATRGFTIDEYNLKTFQYIFDSFENEDISEELSHSDMLQVFVEEFINHDSLAAKRQTPSLVHRMADFLLGLGGSFHFPYTNENKISEAKDICPKMIYSKIQKDNTEFEYWIAFNIYLLTIIYNI